MLDLREVEKEEETKPKLIRCEENAENRNTTKRTERPQDNVRNHHLS